MRRPRRWRAWATYKLLHLEGGALSARGKPYSPKTIAGYREGLGMLKRSAAELGLPDDLRQWKPADLDRYAQHLRARGAKPTTVADRLNVVARFFTWCVVRRLIARSPLEASRRPRAASDPVRPFTRAEVEQLLGACDGEVWIGARDGAIVLTLADTGLRAAELVGLDLADLDWDVWTLRVEHGKGGKKRVARLGLDARRQVADFVELFRGREPGPLFPSRYGKRLSPDALCEVFERLGRRGGVLGAHPHRMRHTFGVEFLRAGGNPFELQLLLGHAVTDHGNWLSRTPDDEGPAIGNTWPTRRWFCCSRAIHQRASLTVLARSRLMIATSGC